MAQKQEKSDNYLKNIGYLLGGLLFINTVLIEPHAIFYLQLFFNKNSISFAQTIVIITFFIVTLSSFVIFAKPKPILSFLLTRNIYLKIISYICTAITIILWWKIKAALHFQAIPLLLVLISFGYSIYQTSLLAGIIGKRQDFQNPPYWDYLLATFLLLFPTYPYLYAWVTGILNFTNSLYRIIGMLLIAPVFAFFFATGWRKCLWMFQFVLYFLILAPLFYISLYQRDMSENTFLIVFNTNPNEALEFIHQYLRLNIPILVYTILFIAILALMYRKRELLHSVRTAKLIILLWAGLILCLVSIPENIYDIIYRNVYADMAGTYKEYKVMLDQQESYLAKMNREIGNVPIEDPYKGREVHLVIIGESTSRTNMGLYGYRRNTTPQLSSLEKTGNLFVFNDVIAPHSHTLETLRKVMSFSNQEHEDSTYRNGVLPQYLKAAGYTTYWLSNQPLFALAGCPEIAAITNTCTNKQFVSDSSHVGYDAEILPFLDEILNSAEEKKFIFVHLMGTHTIYSDRYPRSMAVLKAEEVKTLRPNLEKEKQQIINDYDNAVHYTDYIVGSIVERIKQMGTYASVTFFSDHGEDVYLVQDRASHDETMGTYPMFQIPFALWVSDEFKKNNTPFIEQIADYSNRPYMTDDLIHSMLDLLRIRTPRFEPQRSIFNQRFAERPRIIPGVGNYDTQFEDMTDETKSSIRYLEHLACREKIWVHRVNSIEKLQEVSKIFNGVELDLVFLEESGNFDITHPPVKSIGLNLDHYWGSIEKPEKLGYWLDIKNLSPKLSQEIKNRLEMLVEKYNIPRNQIYVESTQPESLPIFTDIGYKTSYYLPTPFMSKIQALDKKTIDPKDLKQIDQIRKKIKSGRFSGISYDIKCHTFVNTYLPHVDKHFVWGWNDIFSRHTRTSVMKYLEKIPEIEILLVGQTSEYDR